MHPPSWKALFRKPYASRWKGVLVGGLLLSSLAGLGARFELLPEGLYAVLLSLTMPLTMLTLFYEWDITRAIRKGLLIFLFLIGIGATVLTAIINTRLGLFGWKAALCEEPIKALPLLLLAYFPRRFPSPLSGVLMGVCIGTGFMAVETLCYAYHLGAETTPDLTILLLRSIQTPFTHGTWTGILGGILWAVRGQRPGWCIFGSWTFWGALAAVIALHALKNALGVVVYLDALSSVLMVYTVKRAFAETNPTGGETP